MEWLRGWFLSGFPWLQLGYSQIDTPLAGYAPLLGSLGVSWMLAISAGLLVLLLTESWRARWVFGSVLIVIWLAG